MTYDPSGLERVRREERQEGEMACKHQNHGSYTSACVKRPACIYTTLRRVRGAALVCAPSLAHEGAHARNSTALLHLSYYTYGQVEPLVLLNQITSEVAEDRYFRVSFPGNRPRDSVASAYFICVREPTPFTTFSARSSIRSSAPCPAVSPSPRVSPVCPL